jgi:hypothetical protein
MDTVVGDGAEHKSVLTQALSPPRTELPTFTVESGDFRGWVGKMTLIWINTDTIAPSFNSGSLRNRLTIFYSEHHTNQNGIG